MTEKIESYPIQIGAVKRDLRLFEVAPGVRIAILNILGDTPFVQAASKALAGKLADFEFDALITAEAKSIPLAYQLSVDTNTPYVVLRKSYKVYMGDALKCETVSITTGKPQTLYLDQKDRDLIAGKTVVLVDDVISTGSTLDSMCQIMDEAGATVVANAAIFTEGDAKKWKDVVALGNLPVWIEGE